MPHHDRPVDVRQTPAAHNESVLDDEDAMEEAAQALRQVEVEAVQPDDSAKKGDRSKT